MSNLNFEKSEQLNRLKEKWEKLEKEAEEAFKQEHISNEHKEKFNRANNAFIEAHKEWQRYLHENADELLPQKKN